MKKILCAGITLGALAAVFACMNGGGTEGKKALPITGLQEYHIESRSTAFMEKTFSEETNAACFTYEELPDGTLRITGYEEEKNTQNPYQVIIPSVIDGKRVSTLGKECLGTSYTGDLVELTVSDGITAIEENIIEHAWDISLIKLPDSVTFIDEKAFWSEVLY